MMGFNCRAASAFCLKSLFQIALVIRIAPAQLGFLIFSAQIWLMPASPRSVMPMNGFVMLFASYLFVGEKNNTKKKHGQIN